MKKILIIGCGEIGSLLATKLCLLGHQVYGIRRSDHVLEGVTMLQADVSRDFSLYLQSKVQSLDYVYIILSPDSSTLESYQRIFVDSLTYIRKALSAYNIQHVFFVSSTSVYGQNQGQWVDENSETKPTAFNGQVLVQAEQLCWQAWSCTVLRCGGIYGNGRLRLIQWIKSRKPVQHGAWTNRVHVFDVVGILFYLFVQHQQNQNLNKIYLAVDDCPVLQDTVLDWLAEKLKQPPLEKITAPESNRRVSNQAIKNLGYCFLYPSYKDGYSELIK